MFFNGAFSAGNFSNHLDLAPNFAGTLMGISNTLAGGATGFVVPTVIGAIRELEYLDAFTRWKIIFTLAAGIYFFGNFCFVFMVSGKVQPWNFESVDRTVFNNANCGKEMESVQEEKEIALN